MIHCKEVALQTKLVAGDDEDGDTVWTELRENKTKPNKTVCVHLRQSAGALLRAIRK